MERPGRETTQFLQGRIMCKLMSVKRILLAALAAGAVLAAASAPAQLFMTEKEVMRQARLQWLDLKRHQPRAPDPRTQAYVECISNEIIDVLGDEYDNLDWEIIVFDNDSFNAFALPGGKIGVFTGILDVADTPDALAAVIGHEIAHLTQDHVMERAKKRRRTEALVLLGGAATGMRGEVRDAATIFRTLPYAREQETEADRVGLDYMAQAGFDPRASLMLWKNMSSQRGRDEVPEFLSTHPADDVRMDELVRAFASTLGIYNTAREEGRYPSCRQP